VLQGGTLLAAAKTSIAAQWADLIKFLSTLSSPAQASRLQAFLSKAGWHPFIAELLTESWKSLREIRSKESFAVEIDSRINSESFSKKIDSISSENERYLVTSEVESLLAMVKKFK